MTPRPVVLRARAREDVDEAIAHYLDHVGVEVANGFIEALEEALAHVAARPGSGSPRYAHEVNLPGLRSRPLKSYPFLVFYMTTADRIDVWRVLHARREIPAWLRAP